MVATKESFNYKKGAMETNRTASKFNKIKFEEIWKFIQTLKLPFKEKSSFEKEGERQWNTDFIIDRIGHSTL